MEGQTRRCGISKSVSINQSINRDFVDVCVCCDIRGYMKEMAKRSWQGRIRRGKGVLVVRSEMPCNAMQCHAMHEKANKKTSTQVSRSSSMKIKNEKKIT